MNNNSENNDQQIPTYDLVIIGYGMVGSIAALLAVQYKLKVAVLEIRRVNELYVPKAGRIDAEVIRIFEQLGLKKEMDALVNPILGTKVVDKNNKLLFELQHPVIEGFAPMYSIFQPDVQAVLHKEAKHRGDGYVTLFEKHRAEAIQQNKDRVRIIAHDLEKDNFFEIKARFLLACNGQESLVPAQCDLKFKYFDFSNFSLNVDTYCKDAITLPKYARTICNTEFPVTCITDSEHHQRWEFKLDPDALALPDINEKIRGILEQLIGHDFELLSSFLHGYETRILEKWQRKRIFITGDAAHVLPPYLGVALSAGIKDVYNLIWKIAFVAERRIGGKVLDSYQEEREYSVRYLLKLNMAVQKLFNSAWLRFASFVLPFLPKSILNKRLDLRTLVRHGIVGFLHPLRGTVIPYFKFRPASNPKIESIDTLIGDDFALISFGENPVDICSPNEIEFSAKLGLRFIKVYSKNKNLKLEGRFTEIWHDADGEFEQWCKKHKIKHLILRPDRLIFDLASDEKQLKKVYRILINKMPLRTNKSI